jgi:hypothetical protein
MGHPNGVEVKDIRAIIVSVFPKENPQRAAPLIMPLGANEVVVKRIPVNRRVSTVFFTTIATPSPEDLRPAGH